MTPIQITGITEDWSVMASVSGIQAFCNWHQAWKAVPNGTHGSASITATKAKAALGAIGAQECLNVWLKKAEAVKPGRTESHQDNRNYPLHLIFASIKFQKAGIKSRWDLEGRMESVMAIGSEVFGSCVEGMWVDVGLKNAEALFAVLWFFCGLIRWLGGWKLWLSPGILWVALLICVDKSMMQLEQSCLQ